MKRLYTFLFLFLCNFFISLSADLTIIIPSYNNKRWYKANLDSLVNQTVKDWECVYVDDCSPDGTGDWVQKYIDQNNLGHKITLIQNKKRRGALANLYYAIHSCDDSSIVVTLDGDDWFAHENVLQKVLDAYADDNVWMTYGQYIIYPEMKTAGSWREIPADVIEANSFREHEWYASHLRTFYAGLFKRIAYQDFLYEGSFFEVAWDMAFMFPMLEMAGNHAKHMKEILYVYNQDNPINDFKKDMNLVKKMEQAIRSKSVYDRAPAPY